MRDGDTIVALSSGPVPSGIAVLRLSGPATGGLLIRLMGALPAPRLLTLATLEADGLVFDRGLAAWFPAPHSFTGEDCGELQVHGSRAVVRALLRWLGAQSGVRLAEAGEFTRRAFESGKLDLIEVEGLGDLIAAETEGQRRLALERMKGVLSARVAGWREQLLGLRAEVEARLDFSDEGDVGEAFPDWFDTQLGELGASLRATLAGFNRGRSEREGFRVAIAGPPNAGKSSLLNALAGSDLAIVSDEAGTTRDVREVSLELDGRLVVLIDMAGLRTAEGKAEAEGVRRAHREISRADLVLWLVAPDVSAAEIPGRDGPESWVIRSKADIAAAAGVVLPATRLAISAATGTGIAALLDALAGAARGGVGAENALISHERDRLALAETLAALDSIDLARPEIAGEALRHASQLLGRLIGTTDAEAVLDRLFTSFCIGK